MHVSKTNALKKINTFTHLDVDKLITSIHISIIIEEIKLVGNMNIYDIHMTRNTLRIKIQVRRFSGCILENMSGSKISSIKIGSKYFVSICKSSQAETK